MMFSWLGQPIYIYVNIVPFVAQNTCTRVKRPQLVKSQPINLAEPETSYLTLPNITFKCLVSLVLPEPQCSANVQAILRVLRSGFAVQQVSWYFLGRHQPSFEVQYILSRSPRSIKKSCVNPKLVKLNLWQGKQTRLKSVKIKNDKKDKNQVSPTKSAASSAPKWGIMRSPPAFKSALLCQPSAQFPLRRDVASSCALYAAASTGDAQNCTVLGQRQRWCCHLPGSFIVLEAGPL